MPDAKLLDTYKNFNYKLEFADLDPVLIQEVTPPDIEVTTATHFIGTGEFKTASRVTTGDMTLKKLVAANNADNFFFDWVNDVIDMLNLQAGVPSEYKRNGYMIQLQPNGESILRRWQVMGAFPKTIPGITQTAGSDDDFMEELVLSVDRYIPL